MHDKVLLIDGNSIMNRAYYGLPLLSNSEGVYTNAVLGFLNIILKAIKDEEATHIGVAFDLKAPTFRHEKYKEYKGNRKGMPDELRMQMPIIKDVLKAMDISIFEMEGYEADDVLGTLAHQCEKIGVDTTVLSGDRDLLQLATKHIKISIPKTKKGSTTIENYFEADVLERYGVTPTEFIDLKGLMGDSSDNIPGVPGIGEKTAIKIIATYHSIEEAYRHIDQLKPPRAAKNLEEHYDLALLSKELATICVDCDVCFDKDSLKIDNIYNEATYKLFKQLEFKRLLEKFEGMEEDSYVEDLLTEHLIETKEALDQLVSQLQQVHKFAYYILTEGMDMIGISIAYNENEAYFIKCQESMDDAFCMAQLKDIFESHDLQKMTHGLKEDLHLFNRYKIEPKSIVFDTFVGAYTVNPTRDTYGIDDIANDYLKVMLPSQDELLGKGKSRISYRAIEPQQLLTYACHLSSIIYRSYDLMHAAIEEYGMHELFYNIEMPLIQVLYDMEYYGIKVDSVLLHDYADKLKVMIDLLESEIYELADETFNIKSPKQLGVILFEKLKLPVIKKTKTGYSTAAEVLEKLKGEHPIIDKISEYRQLTKLKSTYADGLFDYIGKEDSRIHSSFQQTIAATGRISSTEPNLQNIPIRMEMGREIRKVFVPEDDYIFIDADYSQIELRLLAHLAEDETLINAFNEGQDIHRLTASQVFHVPFDEVSSLERSNAKAVNFGIVYGIGAFSLSQDLHITRKEAQEYIQNYFKKYPSVKIYLDNCIRYAKNRGYSLTMLQRRRPIPELASSNFMQRSFGERVAMNTPIQGSAADVIKIAMINVSNKLKSENLRSRLILQVHDELLIEAHRDEVELVKQYLVEEMENAVQISVKMKVDVNIGMTWYDTK
ncbi:DNA polymerase I [Vallitalea pronyensis]|uniref:DNA polymerase I n=1 Tax=Vallitalea pronyensis TaxID=1348613 RepID=A0A8J8MLH5_9FIRM|nr:DNA polymerase I [Vallitalea pronyensis]QUI23453.1 DNA polymerase I [Vallitalea pronyensis]